MNDIPLDNKIPKKSLFKKFNLNYKPNHYLKNFS